MVGAWVLESRRRGDLRTDPTGAKRLPEALRRGERLRFHWFVPPSLMAPELASTLGVEQVDPPGLRSPQPSGMMMPTFSAALACTCGSPRQLALSNKPLQRTGPPRTRRVPAAERQGVRPMFIMVF